MPHPVNPASTRGSPSRPPPGAADPASDLEVLVVLPLHVEGAGALLTGISRANQLGPRWRFFFDFDGRSLTDQEALHAGAWRGVLCAGGTDTLRRACARRNLPLVELGGGNARATTVAVRSNDEAVGRLAARRALELGAATPAFIRTRGSEGSQRRETSFLAGLRTRQTSAPLTLALDEPSAQPCRYREQVGQIGRWLSAFAALPAVVVADSAARAHQVVLAAGACGLAVPGDVSVLALSSDDAVCAAIVPPVESIDVGAERIGAAAVDTLAHLLTGETEVPSLHEIEPAGVIVRSSTHVTAGNPGLVSRALSFIRTHAMQPPSVADVMRHTGATRPQLEHAFRRCLDRSPQQEIRRLRVEILERALARSDEPLSVLARLTGFKHVEYLSVFFKRATGMSPGEFRRRSRPHVDRAEPPVRANPASASSRVA